LPVVGIRFRVEDRMNSKEKHVLESDGAIRETILATMGKRLAAAALDTGAFFLWLLAHLIRMLVHDRT
jgi:hypothetical protein